MGRGRPPKTVNWWIISDMLKYADDCYHKNGKLTLGDTNKDEDDYNCAYQYIASTLHLLKLDNNRIKNKRNIEVRAVAEPVAKFLIEDYLKDYFEADNKKAQKMLKELFSRLDEDLNAEQEALYSIFADPGNSEKSDDELSEIISDAGLADHFYNNVHKKNFRYHLPELPVEDFPLESIDEIVDRTMIRTLFYHFYDFDEEEFRKALIDRAELLYNETGRIEYSEGYSKLTADLENPVGHYIFQKREEKNSKK